MNKKTWLAVLIAAALMLALGGCTAETDANAAKVQASALIQAAEADAEEAAEEVAEEAKAAEAAEDAAEEEKETEQEEAPSAAKADKAEKPDKPTAPTATADSALHCTISISCASILQHQDQLDPAKSSLIPSGGSVLSAREVSFTQGESVFDVLQRTCREQSVHLEFSETPMYDSAYIEGIANIYEFDCGELSGWMYSVNGWFPNYGCSRYRLSDGDVIAWVYTCELGADVGGSGAAQ